MDISVFLGILGDTEQGFTLPLVIDYFSVIVGVITGALFACEKKLDIVGTVALGLITGYGGGIIRDMLLQDKGVYFTSHPDLVLICIAICFFVFYFRGIFKQLKATVFLCDSLSVALFAVAGASKAFACGEGLVMTVLLGAITSVGGGAIRDICVGEVPGIFKRSNLYAVAGLAGSTIFTVLAALFVPQSISALACVFSVVTLRYWSVYSDWKTTDDADLTPRVTASLLRWKQSLHAVFLQGGNKGK